MPWLSECMEEMTFVRTPQEEGTVLWVNMVTAGVVPLMKKNFLVSLVTGLLTSCPTNACCVLIHTNRASESKSGSETQFIIGFTN